MKRPFGTDSQASGRQAKSVHPDLPDTTDRDAERHKLEAQLLRAQRLESIGTIASGLAHDLNNVLTPVLMGVQMLRKSLPGEHEQHILDTLEASALRGSLIIRQVLSFARGVGGERIPVQVRHIIDEIAKIAQETFPRSIEIACDVPAGLWLISADATQIHQVLMNLAVNARDAMPKGGTLSFTARNIRLDAQYAAMDRQANAGPYVMITIADTGTGIPPGLLRKIFDPFFTTKSVTQGTGLGLSTALAIVKSHRGYIDVESTVGKGTTFTVFFPAQEQPAVAVAPEEEGELRGAGELILVVDDEASILEITRETLEDEGYAVLTARDGAEAVAEYARSGGKISVVITDMMMPYMDGASTIRALRRLNPSVKVIAVSGLPARRTLPWASSGPRARSRSRIPPISC